MVPFLLNFATPAPAGATARLIYVPERRLNLILSGSPRGDGTLITKSHEAADQSEIAEDLHAATSCEGTLLTCTREASDYSEVVEDLHAAASSSGTRFDELAALLGTKKTGAGEQSDPSDVVVEDYAEDVHLPILISISPWPVTRLTFA
ncbi:hypothetical protein WMF45_48930 [Sorangium sp. So ce448]|uniref:hypothetical protein n=1 Tax=Sorangium sp. So ce448 TaxID=3133314 RepID=UPI003F5F7113